MSLSFRTGVLACRIVQILPQLHPDPNQARISSKAFGGALNGNISVLLDQGSTSLTVGGNVPFRAGIIQATSGLADTPETYPFLVVLELVVQVDGARGTIYATLDIEHDESDPEGLLDVYTLREAGETVKTNGLTIRFEGIRGDSGTTGPTADISNGIYNRRFDLMLSIVSSQLGDQDCSTEEFAFDSENCECTPFCEFDIETLVDDCLVKDPLPPVRGCQDLPSLIGSSALIVANAGTPGAPGAPGAPGGIGPMGPPGLPGPGGCNSIIIWSQQTVYTPYCSGPGFAVVVIPFGQCHYWVHIITYVCTYWAYTESHCCTFIFCDEEWVPIREYFQPDGEDSLFTNLYELNLGSDCIRGTKWSMTAADAIGPGTYVGEGDVSGRFYYETCSVERPAPYEGNSWSNRFAEDLMAAHGDTEILERGAGPDCCVPPGGFTDSAGASYAPPSDPCELIATPTFPGRIPGEAITLCDCEEEATTTCDIEETIWSLYWCPTDAEPGTGIPVGVGPDDCLFFAICSVESPDDELPWVNVHPECLADQLGVSYRFLSTPPRCCGPEKPCENATTTCDPESTLWTTLCIQTLCPDGEAIGHNGAGGTYISICAVEPPDDGNTWINGDGYCMEQLYGYDFYPYGNLPECCGETPTCDVSTTVAATTTPAATTTDEATTSDGPTTSNPPL